MSRVVLLTGAAGGLGRAMAAGLVGAGFGCVLVDRDTASLQTLADALRQTIPGAALHTLGCDLSDAQRVGKLPQEALAAFGRVDILVNNAGLGLDHVRRDFMQRPIRFWEVPPDAVARYFAVNGQTPFALAQALAPAMMAQGWGRIVNVTTSLDSMIRGGFAPYGGTKASLEAHSAIMAADLADTGVTVNVLVPGGPADTPMIPVDTGFARDRLIRPEAMVAPLLWLLSDEAAATTNHRLLAARWRGAESLAEASGPIAWPQLGAQTLWPS